MNKDDQWVILHNDKLQELYDIAVERDDLLEKLELIESLAKDTIKTMGFTKSATIAFDNEKTAKLLETINPKLLASTYYRVMDEELPT